MAVRWIQFVHVGGAAVRRIFCCLFGLLTMLELGSTLSMALSMVLSVVIYALAFGWKFALGFVFLLLIHELGHLLASRLVGIRTSMVLFIPFIGAVISLSRSPVNAKMEANIALGGPALGCLSALGCLAVYFWTDSSLMLALSYCACLLNLFNLIPAALFDGGKIGAAIAPGTWRLGSGVLLALFLYTKNPVIFGILLFSLWYWWQSDDMTQSYYRLTLKQRLDVAWQYFGLLTVLGICTLYIFTIIGR